MSGVNFMSKFITSTNKKFNSYIDYLDRKDAVRNDSYNRYSLYNDYMGNPDKTTGIFTDSKDNLNSYEKNI